MLICGEKFEDKYGNDEKYCKVRNHWHHTDEFKGAAHSICTYDIVYLKKLLHFFAIDQAMIIILSKKM